MCLSLPNWWGKTGVEFVTHTNPKMSRETTNMVIPITDGVGEGDLGRILPPQASQDRGLWCLLWPTPVQLM